MSANRILHILSTEYLDDDAVLLRFADGTTAVYESSELEKLRPRQRELAQEQMIASRVA